MDYKIKINLSVYGIVSAISFIYLILNDTVGIGIPIFFIIQLTCLCIVLKNMDKVENAKGLLLMVPIIIISLNFFMSSNYIWAPTNFLAIVFLYSSMFLMIKGNLNLGKLNIIVIIKVVFNIFEPLLNFIVPLKWISEKSKTNEKNMLLKRIFLGVLISMPCVLFLTIMLSSADMIFYNNFKAFNKLLENFFYNLQLFKFVFGTFAGLYLFGHLYNVLSKDENFFVKILNERTVSFRPKGDVIVFNILLLSVLTIYTIFISIQFKYLFSSGELPYGLNYAEYARRGFFELVFLSVINIVLIMLGAYMLKDKIYGEKNKWALFTKVMMVYLCVVTGILLYSSYYRMSLYDSAYGFTRLRILVYMFLMFECFTLIATLTYIIKHNFNILVVYLGLCLAFYMTLNMIKIDEIIAKRNIDMFLNGRSQTVDMDYLMTLSPDAVPEIFRLLNDDVEITIRIKAKNYLLNMQENFSNIKYCWQGYNLSAEKNKELFELNKDIMK